MMKKGLQTHVQVTVLNSSHHDVVLQPKVTLRSIHMILSISPLEPLKLTDKEKQQYQPGNGTDDHIQKVLREVD